MREVTDQYRAMGYTAPNAAEMAERNMVDRGGGTFRRHPSRLLFEGGFADGGTTDILRMYRRIRSPTLLVRCTHSGAPEVLDHELDQLAATNEHVHVERIPATHLAPAWDAIDTVTELTVGFFSSHPPPPDDRRTASQDPQAKPQVSACIGVRVTDPMSVNPWRSSRSS